MNIKRLICAVGACMAASGFAALPDKAYVIGYWTPPVDMVPSAPIRDYNPSTRVPEYFWLKYDGAYTLALRLHPIAKEKIEKEIAVGLISTNANKLALTFSPDVEKNVRNRRVGVYDLDLDATEFTALSFKVRGKAKNAGDALIARLSGKGFGLAIDPANPAKTLVKESAKDGFTCYTLPFTARANARITALEFELPAATAADFEQAFEIIDLHLKRPAPKARFEDLPPRTWVKKQTQEPTGDIFEYVRGAGAADTIAALPKTYELRPQLEKDKDSGYTVEYVTAKVGGRELPAVKITLVKGDRCLLRFPIAFDGLDYNTMTFAGKVEVFDGAKPVLGDVKPMLWGANQITLNQPFDTFQVSFFSKTDDFRDWTRGGLAQADYCQNKDLSCALSKDRDGWRAFAYDIANSDPSNNKSSFYTKLTHWCFYYNNRKIPEGKKVVVTIADPRLTKGVMLTGGDAKLYAEFLKTHDPKRMVDMDALDGALEPPKGNRLAKPMPFVRGGRPVGSIYLLGGEYPGGTSREARTAYDTILKDAADVFCDVLQRKYAMCASVPVKTKLPKKGEPYPVNAIIVGGREFANFDKATYDADIKAMKGKPGVAIRSDGTNLYVYATGHNYAGNARSLAFGLYELLENNTDLIWPHVADSGYAANYNFPVARVFKSEPYGDLDLVWGDGFTHVPPVEESSMFGAGGVNRMPGFNWIGDWSYGRHRTRSINHSWSYGTEPIGGEKRGEPNDTWGRRADGTLMKPGCYTGHPCLVRVLDRAREAYLASSGWAPRPGWTTEAPGKAFAWNCYDVHGLWVEDSISMCQCEECLTKIRLGDGSTVGPDSPYFRSTQFYANGSAMINAVNVYANRKARIESIGYFWMAPVPLFNVSRSYDIRFCPYIRKNYFVPIFAPMNDMHWRAIVQWSQQDVRLAIYEYFLQVNLRPWADVAVYDFRAECKLGFYDWMAEAGCNALAWMDKWVMERLIWGAQGDDIAKLRAYYLKRTFREAAEPMAKFYQTVMGLASEKLAFASPIEFEDAQVLYRTAMRTKAEGLFASGTVADELENLLCEAEDKAKDPNVAAELRLFREAWDKYKADALVSEEKWKQDVTTGAAEKPMKIVGAPD